MKSLVLTLGLLLSNVALAAPDACVDFMKCGTYEGPGRNYDRKNAPVPKSNFVERITLTNAGPLQIHLEQSMWTAGKPSEVFYKLDLDVTFQEDGTYVAKYKDGQVYAAGICQTGRVCTLSMIPFAWEHEGKSGATGNVNILRFEDGKLSRSMMAESLKNRLSFQRSELTQK